MFQYFTYLPTTESTNDYLKQFVNTRVPQVVAAGEQTAGRGRYGRSWYSPAGQGLYISYLFFPDWPSERMALLNQASSLAMLETLRSLKGAGSADIRLKAPNDVLINGRKVCGILAELGTTAEQINWAIVGFGLNLYQKEFPPELKEKATSLAAEGIEVPDIEPLRTSLTAAFEHLLQQIEKRRQAEVEALYFRSLSDLRE